MLKPHSPFYNRTIRSYIVSFGNLFNEIQIIHYDGSDNVMNQIEVPIAFTQKEKYIQRYRQDYPIEGDEENTKIQMTLPRLGFDMVGMGYDPERKLNTLNQLYSPTSDNGDNKKSMYTPVPWNYDFELYLMGKQFDEMLQVTEQIAVFFGPHFMLNIKDNVNFDTNTDIPLVFNGIRQEDDWGGDMGNGERRILIWTFSFTLKGWLYGPATSMPLIKQVEGNVAGFDCKRYQTIITKVDPIEAGPADPHEVLVEVIDYVE